MKRLSFLAYAGVFVLLAASSLTFVYNRAGALWRTVKQAATNPSLSTAYNKNDRYYPIIQVQQKYPSYPVYFLSNSLETTEASYLWQMVQSYYLTYPKAITELRHNRDNNVLSQLKLREKNGIVISPFTQTFFEDSGEELHPHAEYYLYIIHTK